MTDGDWAFIPTASPDGLYVVQAPVAGDPDDVRVLPTQVIMAGTAALRPAASAAYNGCLYLETDTAGGTLFRCDGTAWVQTALGVRPNQLKIAQDLYLEGDTSPAQITGDQNDYNPSGLATAAVLRLSSDAARNLTGLAGGVDGRVLVVHNVGSNRIVLKDESSSSTASNRFALNADLTLSADQSCVLWYDATSSRWRAAAASTAPPHDHTANDGSGVLTNDEHDGFGEYAEISSPASPAADKLRHYARDVGGVTHLAYKRSTGLETLLSGVIDRKVTETEVANTTAETIVYSFSVPGGTLGTSGMLRLRAWADYLNDSGAARDLTVRVKYGGATMLVAAFTSLAASATRRAVRIEADLVAENATNAQRAGGAAGIGLAGSSGTPGFDAYAAQGVGVHNSMAIDSTANQTLEVTAQHSFAATTISFKLFNVVLEKL